jgi:hypothetical protein
MKKNVYLLLLVGMSFSCGWEEQRAVRQEARVSPREEIPSPEPVVEEPPFDNTAEIDSLAEAIDLDVEGHPGAAAGNAFIFNPFGVEEGAGKPFPLYRQKIKAPVAVKKEAYRNRHYPSRIDTIYHLQFDSSSISLYHPVLSDRYMLSEADIKSPNITLEPNIRVGMSRQELLNKLKEYKLYIKEQGDSIEVTSLVTETSLVFILQDRKLQRIKYHPYLD